jgi:hypothetical protein
MTTYESLHILTTVADNSSNMALVIALREAADALQRLAAIKAAHDSGAVQTVGGRVVYADIRGSELHGLLYGGLNDR